MRDLGKTLNTVSAEPAKIELRKFIDSITVFPTEPYKPYDIKVRGPIAALSLVAGAGFRRQDYAGTEIKEIFRSIPIVAAYSKPRFINIAWDIGPRAAGA